MLNYCWVGFVGVLAFSGKGSGWKSPPQFVFCLLFVVSGGGFQQFCILIVLVLAFFEAFVITNKTKLTKTEHSSDVVVVMMGGFVR